MGDGIDSKIEDHRRDPRPHPRLGSVCVAVPITASSPGMPGTIAVDATHIYACVALNTWVRTELATW